MILRDADPCPPPPTGCSHSRGIGPCTCGKRRTPCAFPFTPQARLIGAAAIACAAALTPVAALAAASSSAARASASAPRCTT